MNPFLRIVSELAKEAAERMLCARDAGCPRQISGDDWACLDAGRFKSGLDSLHVRGRIGTQQKR